MRWLITFLLLIGVVAGGLWLAFGGWVRDTLGYRTPEPSAASFTLIDQSLRPEQLQKLTVTPPGHAPLILTRNPDGTWSQPGNWPLREAEVAELVNALTTLRSRFTPLPLGPEAADLGQYGLDTPARRVEVVAETRTEGGQKTLTLHFGRPEPTATESDFARPTYLRIEGQPEVIRLGPDVFPILARSPETYRRRQLFPDVLRVKLTGGEPPPTPLQPTPPLPTGRLPLLGNEYTAIRVEQSEGEKSAYTLTRTAPTPEPRRDPNRPAGEPVIPANQLATAWALEAEIAGKKIRDRVDPARLRTVLTAIPDLWIESFLPGGRAAAATGLDSPARTITVTRADGKTITILLGAVSRSITKTEAPPPPPPFSGQPPPPPKFTTEEYRYARLKDNELVFEVRTDKLGDLFTSPQDLRDPALARFDTGDVTELTISAKGKPPIQLTRRKGNPDAAQEEGRQDRWYVGEVLAEPSRVTEVLDQLTRLEARGPDNLIDNPDPAKLKELQLDPAEATVTVTVQPKVAEGEPPLPARTFTFVIGRDDPTQKKLAVRLAGWDRVNLVDDAVAKLIDRPALAYRGRRLFDSADKKLTTVTVQREGKPAFVLGQKMKPAPEKGTHWVLMQPVEADADDARAEQLVNDLTRLEVTEYVDDAPKPEDLDKKYGLTKPRFTVNLRFIGLGARPQTLEIGAAREGKSEAYGRLNGTGSVFAVNKSLVDALDQGAVALLPLQLWSTTTDRITAVEVQRGSETYRLNQVGAEWKLAGPFEATVGFAEVQPLVAAVANLRAEKYDALTPDPARHGLDLPALRLTITYKETKPGEPAGETPVTRTLLVGKETAPGAATRFARLGDGANQAVFVLPDNLIREADKPALERLDRSILTLDPGQVTRVQVVGPTPDANVTLTRDDRGNWKADGAAFPIDRPTVEALLATAARPPVVRLAAYGPQVQWTDYGLDKPPYTITLTLAGDKPRTHTLHLGKAEPSGERYVRADNGPAVGVLAPRSAEALARGKLDFVDRSLLTFDPQQLTALSRTRGKDTLELTQAGLNWEVTRPTKMKADRETVEQLAEQLGRLRAARVAAVAPADLEKPYGLKDSAMTVTLTVGTDKPEKKVLKLGHPVDAAKPDGERYALAEGSGPTIVGVLPGSLVKRLLGEPIKFRDRSLAKFVDADRLVLERGDRKVTFAKVDGTWKVTEPVMADAEQGDLDELVNALANLRADELVAEKPADLKPFGLAPPEAKWQLFAGDREVLSLLVGTKEKDSPRAYARLEKGDLVALLDPTLTNRVLGEYRKRAIFTDLDASQVESLVISTGTANFILRKEGSEWKDPAKPSEPIDAARVTETLATLAGLKAERFVADHNAKLALYGLEKPQRVIVATQKGGVSKTLQIGGPVGGTQGRQVYARVPDSPAVFVLSEADTAKLTRDRGAFTGKK